MLSAETQPIGAAYDVVIFDLDGVIYVGDAAVSGAAEAVARLRDRGTSVAFVTNNASRTPQRVAAKLRDLGVLASANDVVTSAQAAARLIAEQFGPEARAFVIGGEGLWAALEEVEVAAVAPAEADDGWPEVDVVVSGYGPDVRWREVMLAATLVRRGVPYVATNTDSTIPTAIGPQPGHGVLVDTISHFAGVEPLVAGKPAPTLLHETIRRMGGSRPLMVGDRLDTDIAGGAAIDADTLLVMTGVTGVADLVAARGGLRPRYVGADLSVLDLAQPSPRHDDGAILLGGWRAFVERGEAHRLRVAGTGTIHDWWRVVAAAGWAHLDQVGEVVDVSALNPPG